MNLQLCIDFKMFYLGEFRELTGDSDFTGDPPQGVALFLVVSKSEAILG